MKLQEKKKMIQSMEDWKKELSAEQAEKFNQLDYEGQLNVYNQTRKVWSEWVDVSSIRFGEEDYQETLLVEGDKLVHRVYLPEEGKTEETQYASFEDFLAEQGEFTEYDRSLVRVQ